MLVTAAHATLPSTQVSKDSLSMASYLSTGVLGLQMCVTISLSLMWVLRFWTQYTCFQSNKYTAEPSPQTIFCPILASPLDSPHPGKGSMAGKREKGQWEGCRAMCEEVREWVAFPVFNVWASDTRETAWSIGVILKTWWRVLSHVSGKKFYIDIIETS